MTGKKILFFTLILPLLAYLSLISSPTQANKEDLEGLEDNLLVLSKVSEQITINQLSLRNFRCRERIVVMEFDKKSQVPQRREFTSIYEVCRESDKRANEQLFFSESRKPTRSENEFDRTTSLNVPVIENPFTGYMVRMFSFENRLSSDFKRVRKEKVGGQDCMVFAFETVPEVSASKIPILGKAVTLRQRGLLWVDVEGYQLVRITAKQLKLPKSCRAYEYRVDFSTQVLSGKRLSLPTHTELKVELKDKSFQVEQYYGEFQSL